MEKNKLKLLSIMALMLTVTSFSGCKFIEKAPEDTEPTENLGDIVIDDPNEKETTPSEETTEPSSTEETVPPKTEPQTEIPPETTLPEETQPSEKPDIEENQETYNGIVFTLSPGRPKMWIKTNCNLFSTADMNNAPENIQTGTKGSVVVLYAISQDGKIAKVALGSRDYFLPYDNLSVTKVDYDKDILEPVDPTDPPKPTNPPEPPTEPVKPPKPTEPPKPTDPPEPPPPPPTDPPAPPKPPRPEVPQGGIPYPPNPESTSVNLMVTFADVDMTGKVVADAVASSGPGDPIPANGYNVLANLKKNQKVHITGIGQNGYVRIDLDGQKAYVLNIYLIRL